MTNLSLNSENIVLNAQSTFYVIDALYLQYIKEKIQLIKKDSFEESVRSIVFPYLEFPFGKFSTSKLKYTFNIQAIKKVNETNASPSTFATDSGLLIILRVDIVFQFLAVFDYYELTNTLTAIIDASYWDRVSKTFPINSCALILSPGINMGVEFDGSGLYNLNL